MNQALPSRTASETVSLAPFHTSSQDTTSVVLSAPRRKRLGLWVGTALVASSLFGCAGPRIRTEYTQAHAKPVPAERQARAVSEANQAPYQLAFRLGPGFLDAMTTAMFGDMVANPEGLKQKISSQREASGSTGGGGGGLLGGGGPFGGRLLERFGNGNLQLNPELEAKSVQVNFPENCNGCLRLRFVLEGSPGGGELRNIRIGGQVGIRGKIEATEQRGKPAISVGLDAIEGLDLQLPVALPGPFALIEQRVEQGLQEQLTQAIQSNQSETHRVIPLADKFQREGMALEGLGIYTRPSPNGELFVGINTTLNAAPSIRFDARSPALTNADWALTIGDDVVTALLRQAVQAGKIPSRYNTKGKPDPEGKVAMDFQGVHFTPKGFEITTRVWHLGWPAFWRDYTVFGGFDVDNGKIQPRIDQLKAGKGSGAAWLTWFAERRMNPDKMVSKLSNRMPDDMRLPVGDGLSASLIPTLFTPVDGGLMVSGQVKMMAKEDKDRSRQK